MQKTNGKLWVRFAPLLVILGLTIAACGGNGDETPGTPLSVSISPPTFSGSLPSGGGETGGGETGGETGGATITVAQAGSLTADFTATAENADGAVAYSWSVEPTSGVALSPASGETTTATFTEAGQYTITVTAEDSSDSDTATAAASIAEPGEEPVDPDPDPGTGGNGDTEPTLTSFGVSDSESGTFTNDGGDPSATPPVPNGISSEDDDRVLDITPGDTFYVQVGASDPEGIDSITIQLRNVDTEDTPDGNNNVTPLVEGTEVEGFTLGAPDCTLPTTETTVTCVYPVVTSAAADESNLTSGEFAYVLRVVVNDVEIGGFGNRGYVNTATTATATGN